MATLTGELTIDGLASGGEGVGRLEDGRVVFVPGAFPGDRVRISRGRLKKRWGRAEAYEIVSRSGDRIDAPCRWAGRCGGCDWMGYDLAAQRRAKGTIVRDALARIGGLEPLPEVDVVSAGSDLGYRRRIRVHARGDVGFHARGSRTIVPIDTCAVAREELNEGLDALRRGSPAPGTWTIQLENDAVRTYAAEAPFVQANAEVNAVLVADVADRAVDAGGPFFEAYAGGGNFSLPLASAGLSGETIEANAEAVEFARAAAIAAGLDDRLSMRVGRAENAALDDVPLVLLDPPRSGARTFCEVVARSKASRVLYVSCDPGTLARDAATLVGAGFTLSSVRAYDMFPHTHHVEVLLDLIRS